MPRIPGLRRLFRLPLHGQRRVAADVDAELRFHMEMREAELRAQGMDERAARDEALRRFGDLEDARRYCRALDARRDEHARRQSVWQGWTQDLRFAARQLRRAPMVTVTAALTIALGVGATTAIYSAVHRLILDPVPYPHGDRLVWLQQAWGNNQMLVSATAELADTWRSGARSLELTTFASTSEMTLREGNTLTTEHVALIEPSLFDMLGARPLLGRTFDSTEMRGASAPVAMLSYVDWRTRFGGTRDILGRVVDLDGRPYTIIGVAPRDFDMPDSYRERHAFFLPLTPDTARMSLTVLARLRPGVTVAQATKELDQLRTAYFETAPRVGLARLSAATGFHAFVRPLGDAFFTGPARDALLILFGAVGLVLLIACANVANVLLARGASRERELAVRTALGAGRGRIVRQLVTESALLALLGGVLGLVLAAGTLRFIVAHRPEDLAQLSAVRLEPGMLAFGLVLALLTGVLFGLLPALLVTDRRNDDALKASGRSLAGRRGARRVRAALVMAEVGLSVVLLVGAGLLVRSLRAMEDVPLGFDAAGLTTLSLAPPRDDPWTIQKSELFSDALLQRVRSVPGVQGATLSSGFPGHGGMMMGALQVEGRASPIAGAGTPMGIASATSDYFSLIRLPVVDGRPFDAHPDTSRHEVLINATMARALWPGEHAVGKRVRFSEEHDAPWNTVVGVVQDVHLPGQRASGRRAYTVYFPPPQLFALTLIVRHVPGGASPIPALRRALAEVNPRMRVLSASEIPDLLDRMLAGPRFILALLSGFATLAVILAAVGLYGVLAYTVTQRTREIGLRIALGASPAGVLRSVLRQGVGMALAGAALGLLAAAALTRLMRSLLFGVTPLDVPSYVTAALLLVFVSVLATWLPAHRAARADPVAALRAD
ncbi:MAG TPA: ABC transporter permease [Gemmatimonadaceae bacterium]|nr:ABC transporter permease [Gemmatimonadaceae bacterium]